jgi:hypothetical protein
MLKRENREDPFQYETNFHQNKDGVMSSTGGIITKYGTCRGGFVFSVPKDIGRFFKVENNEPETLRVEMELSRPEDMKRDTLETEAILYTLNSEYYLKIENSFAVKSILSKMY